MLWAQELGQWSRYLRAAGMATRTIQQYRRTVINFVADTLLELDDVTEEIVVEYLTVDPLTGLPRPPNGSFRGMVLRSFRSLFAWRERRFGRPNPVAALPVPREKLSPAPSLTVEELTRLVVAAAWRSERRAWTILLLYSTGMRLESAVNVRAEDVHGETLYIRVAKGRKPYSVHLGPIGRAAVDGLLPTSNGTLIAAGDGRVWEWIHQAGVDVGIRAHPHLLRHAWATHHLEYGTDVRVLQELGNWADLSQIPRYTATTDKRKRDAQENF